MTLRSPLVSSDPWASRARRPRAVPRRLRRRGLRWHVRRRRGLLLREPTRVVVDADEPRGARGALRTTRGHRDRPECEGTDYYLVEIPEGVCQEDFLEDIDDELEVEDAEEDPTSVAFPEGGGPTIPAFGDEPVASIAHAARARPHRRRRPRRAGTPARASSSR